MKKPLFIILLILLIDQCVKFWVKTTMYIGQEYHIAGNWFIIHFTENNGMAFGMELLEGPAGKLFLSLFRIFAVLGIGVYLYTLVKRKSNPKLVISMSLIFAGATGNIIDSIFYGKIFSSSEYQVASLFPAEGGYANFLHGKVVDMFYFPIIEGHFPQWFPFWGGEDFIFFRPVFNIADSSITIGVFMILIFQSTIFHHEKKEEIQTENFSDNFLSPESLVQVQK
ncbi:MAG TPA: lipoprotein signal peptidase [Bacteroidia bacterium]|nr:lipoprotein signal peptidase [Bacteroidia bacterium]